MNYSLITMGLLAAFSSQAQTTAQENDKSLERIVVTGSRIVESIDEVPATVTVISRDSILDEMKVSTELQNILSAKVPGMAPNTGSSSNSGQTLRGRNALVMIDGVPQSTPLRNGALGIRTLDPNTIERIEVIKGATSIFGNGAAGGIINYITKKAGKGKSNVELGIAGKGSLAKFDDSFGHRVELSADGQLDKASYVFSVAREENGVQRDAEGDIIGLKYGLTDNTTQNVFTKLGYQFDEDKSLQLTMNYYDSQTELNYVDVVSNINSGTKTYAVKAKPGDVLTGEPQGPKDNYNIMLKYVDEEIFTNTQMVVDAYKQKIENIFFYSLVLANPLEGHDGGQSLIKSKKDGLRVVFNTPLEFDNADTMLIYGSDILNDVTSQEMVDGRVWVPEMDMKNVAFFLQSKTTIADDWVVKAGVRQESIDVTVDDYSTLRLCKSADVCSVPMAVKGSKLDYKATTYNVGVRYIGNELFSPFANYSQGADISDLGRLLRTATVNDINLINTKASIIDNYEIGMSSQLDDLFITVAAYRSTSELGATNKYDPATGIYVPVRAPQRIWGWEVSANYQATDELSIDAAYSYNEGKNTEKDVYLGQKQISAPVFTTTVNYQPSDRSKVAVSYIHVGDRDRFEKVDGKYVGDQGAINSYGIVNVSGHYDITESTQVYGGVENLLNKQYLKAKSQGYTYNGYNTAALGASFKIGLTTKF
ncbi:MAG: TonB-dependent receptor [Psychrobium sp.]